MNTGIQYTSSARIDGNKIPVPKSLDESILSPTSSFKAKVEEVIPQVKFKGITNPLTSKVIETWIN